LEAGTREIIENELDDINDQLRTIRSMRENRGPISPLRPLLRLPDESFNSGPHSPQYAPDSPPYAPDSPPYAPGSPEGSLPGINDNYRGSPLGAYEENENSVIDVDPTPPGSPNRTPPPRSSLQIPSAPTHSRRGGTKKRKGKKRKTMKKKKSAKKGKKTKKR
jgi:hypothetical protein